MPVAVAAVVVTELGAGPVAVPALDIVVIVRVLAIVAASGHKLDSNFQSQD